MMKPHCDICEALVVDANPARLVTVDPLKCVVSVTARIEADLVLFWRMI